MYYIPSLERMNGGGEFWCGTRRVQFVNSCGVRRVLLLFVRCYKFREILAENSYLRISSMQLVATAFMGELQVQIIHGGGFDIMESPLPHDNRTLPSSASLSAQLGISQWRNGEPLTEFKNNYHLGELCRDR